MMSLEFLSNFGYLQSGKLQAMTPAERKKMPADRRAVQ
jgi:hypothetical protein